MRPSTTVTTGAYSGNNGARVYDQTHYDIDESTIDISCRQGSIEVHLDERIWWSWRSREVVNLAAGQRHNTLVDVDSSWFDGDHRLYIIATSNGSSCDVSFSSTDR